MTKNIEEIIKEPSIIFKVNQTYEPDMDIEDIYEITRSSWVLGGRRKKAKYAFAVYQGVIKEVFEIHSWHKKEDRWEFEGEPAENIREKYVNLSIDDYFELGEANPVKYVNIEK